MRILAITRSPSPVMSAKLPFLQRPTHHNEEGLGIAIASQKLKLNEAERDAVIRTVVDRVRGPADPLGPATSAALAQLCVRLAM